MLVDNNDFFCWAADEPVDADAPCALNELATGFFLSPSGATPITTEDELAIAMMEIYYFRVDLGLENPVDLDVPVFSELLTCSEETSAIGGEFLFTLEDEIFSGIEIINMGQLLENLAAWLTETYP